MNKINDESLKEYDLSEKEEMLVYRSQKGNPITDSVIVANIFEKDHKNVLRDIRNLVAQNRAAKLWFWETTYKSRGKNEPMFTMLEEGFTLLAMGFTGTKALQFKIDFINAFKAMKEKLDAKQPTYIESLRQLADTLEAKELAEKQLELQAPLVKYAETVTDSTDAIEMGLMAKLLWNKGIRIFGDDGDTGRNRLFDWLRKMKILMSSKTQWNVPYQPYRTWFKVKQHVITINNRPKLKPQPLVTPKGQFEIIKLLSNV